MVLRIEHYQSRAWSIAANSAASLVGNRSSPEDRKNVLETIKLYGKRGMDGAERHSTADLTWDPDSPAASSFSVSVICFFVNLRLRLTVSRRNDLYIGDI